MSCFNTVAYSAPVDTQILTDDGLRAVKSQKVYEDASLLKSVVNLELPSTQAIYSLRTPCLGQFIRTGVYLISTGTPLKEFACHVDL